MMAETALYNEQIVEHSRNPRNHKELEAANRVAEGHNPLCGDHQMVYLQIEGDTIKDISFLSLGDDPVKNCAISKASASMMTRRLKGKTITEAESLFQEFHAMLIGALDEENTPNQLGHLTVFSGVRTYPMRVKCATLPWHTMHAALQGENTTSTE